MDLRNLQFLFKPQYWLMAHAYNKKVDKIISDLLDKHELTFKQVPYAPYKSECVCMLGDAEIWVGNIPYAFGTLYGTELCNYRPSRLTIQRLLKKYKQLKKQSMNEKVNKIRLDLNINKMNKELEKAAENYSENWEEINSSLSFEYMTPIEVSKLDFFNGAKWMQERMYSEEDMCESFLACWKANVPEVFECKLSFKDWIKQFSKLKNNIKENIIYNTNYSKHSNDNIFKTPNVEKKWFQKLE